MLKKRAVSLPLNLTAWWIIAIIVLILSLFLYITLTGKAQGAIETLQKILKFGR